MPTTPIKELHMPLCGLTLSSLPLDVFLDILDHLPASSAVCLSLACKSLYYSQTLQNIRAKELGPRVASSESLYKDDPCCPPINAYNYDYVHIVRMLRKDIPTYILCDFCQRFHPRPTPKSSRPGMEWISCPTAPEKGMSVSWPRFGVRLQFEDVQMVMNRHRWGGPHGAPLSSIAMSTDWDVSTNAQGSPFLGKLGLRPEIFDGNLMLHATQHLFFTQRQTELRCKTIDVVRDSSDAFKVCKHHDLLTDYLNWTIYSLFENRFLAKFVPACDRTRTRLQWCNSCNTCFCLEAAYYGIWSTKVCIERGDFDVPADGIELTLHSWMLLGTCEYTCSPSWLNVSEQREPGDPLYPAHTMVKAKQTSSETFKRIMLPRVQEQYSRMSWSLEAIQHPSLLPAVDRAVALENDPFVTKYHEFTKILRAARYKVGWCDMNYLVDRAFGGRRREWCSTDKLERLKIAKRILREHKRNNAKPGSLKRLGSGAYNKLSDVFKRSHSK